MRNVDVVLALHQRVSDFVDALKRNASEDEVQRILRPMFWDWLGVRELEPLGELLAKSWLETSPSSTLARNLLVDFLTAIGKAEEAVLVESGGAPLQLSFEAGRIAAQMADNVKRSGEALGLLSKTPEEGKD